MSINFNFYFILFFAASISHFLKVWLLWRTLLWNMSQNW